MKKMLSILLAAAMIVCIAMPAYAKDENGAKLGVGMSVIGFSAVDVLSGNTYTSDVVSTCVVTVINEWATWCGPCQQEMPYIQQAHEYYSSTPEADVQIFGSIYVSGDCTPVSAKNFLENNGYTWPNLVEDSVLAQVFNTSQYIPQTIIVDRHGVVRDHIEGGVSSYNEIREWIDGWYDTLLEEEGPIDPPATIPGDVDYDGEITSNDALLILRMALNLMECPDLFAADVDGNGEVQGVDALIVLRRAMGLTDNK